VSWQERGEGGRGEEEGGRGSLVEQPVSQTGGMCEQ